MHVNLYVIVVLIRFALMTNDVEQFLIFFLDICLLGFFVYYLFKSFLRLLLVCYFIIDM